jgi:hypothetical protein
VDQCLTCLLINLGRSIPIELTVECQSPEPLEGIKRISERHGSVGKDRLVGRVLIIAIATADDVCGRLPAQRVFPGDLA